jgi:hypothetical protein
LQTALIQLVYVSSGTRKFATGELVELLRVSRRNNQSNDITGMLIYHDGNFIQVLEGPPQPVAETFRRIGEDRRHRGLIEMLNQTIDQRDFPDWTMGFVAIEKDMPPDLLGFADLLKGNIAGVNKSGQQDIARRLIAQFRESMRV